MVSTVSWKRWIDIIIDFLQWIFRDTPAPPPVPPPEPPPPEPPPVPPPLGPQPSDYYTLSVGARIINDVLVDSRTDISIGIWTSVRNLNYAATRCGDAIQENFGMSPGDMIAIARVGQELWDGFNNHWKKSLSTENKRAATDSRFAGRSNTRKEYWRPFADRLRLHNIEVSKINNRCHELPEEQLCKYDNVAGWCLCHWRGPLT